MARVGLTPESVTLAAAELADEHGWQHLTLAAVAAKVGVRQPSLYKHVASLAALRQAVSRLAVAELGERMSTAIAGRAGFDALIHVADAYRDYSHTHPGRYASSVIAPHEDDIEHHRISQTILTTLTAVLRGYGLTDDPENDDALHSIRALRALLHGFVALESAGGFGLDLDVDESFSRLVTGFDATLREQAPGRALP